MLSPIRFDEDRRPSPHEKIALRVQARQAGRSFAAAWVRYMKREQALLDAILRAEARVIRADFARGVRSPLTSEAAVLERLESIMNVLGCSAYRAMCLYHQSPEKECDPDRVYEDTAATGTGGIDDADFYFPDFYAKEAA